MAENWEKYSEEELQKIANSSEGRTDFCKKIGYKNNMSQIFKKIIKKYPNFILPQPKSGVYIDLTGQTFGYLTVLKENIEKRPGGEAYWDCKCSCGNITTVAGYNLRNGITKSCGCLWYNNFTKARFQDLTGQTFGYLTVLKRDESKPKGHQKPVYWICECQCKKQISVLAENLRKGNTQSCGCKRISHGEELIKEILIKNNIKFLREYRISSIKDKRACPFDFAIFDNDNKLIALVEFQGIQHYQHISAFGDEEHFKDQQRRDKIKRDGCIKLNIPLLIFNYKQSKEEIEEIIKKHFK